MRFNKPEHYIGETRVVKRFATIPIRANKSTVIWWESYWSVEMYNIRWDGGRWETVKIVLINPDNKQNTYGDK